MGKNKRTDCHRPGAIVPADYQYVISYSCASKDFASYNVNCELQSLHGPDGIERGRRQHTADGRCCVIGLRGAGAQFFDGGGIGKCSVCGASYISGDVWRHVPTGQHIHVGHNCADKYEMLQDRTAWQLGRDRERQATATALLKAKNAEARKAFLDAHAGLAEALEADHDISRDLKAKFTRFATLSDKQVELALKLQVQVNAPKVEDPKVLVVAGRRELSGQVLGTKVQEGQYGSQIKMLVRLEDGSKVWGTVPSSLLGNSPVKGRLVKFTATVAVSPRDPYFGFFKRPTTAVFTDTVDTTATTLV